MSKEKFTPGPWEYDKYSLYVDSVPRVAEEYSEEICEVSGCRKQDEANGYLIAAAPDMYGLLERMKTELRRVEFSNLDDASKCADMILNIETVLKKARGEEC